MNDAEETVWLLGKDEESKFTVERFLRARGKIMKNKASDCLVIEMLDHPVVR